jgi:hypothetical protein
MDEAVIKQLKEAALKIKQNVERHCGEGRGGGAGHRAPGEEGISF